MHLPNVRSAAALRTAVSRTTDCILETLEHRSLLSGSIGLEKIGSFRTGGYEVGAAEISAYDRESRRLFVVNAQASTIDILNLRNPSSITRIGTIDVSALGSPNSVAVDDNVVAVAVQAPVKTDAGKVAFYKTDGQFINAVKVGALPDMLTFTPDGKFLLVANEGEPNSYGQADSVDPEGTVSVIPVPNGIGNVKKLKDSDVKTAGFTQFNGKEDELRAKGIRIYGPGASAAQDFEPEYITVSDDSKTAYVTLQENNAVAVIDVRTASVKKLLPLGYKDWNKPATTKQYTFDNAKLPSIGTTIGGQEIKLGGFSGLFFEGRTRDGKLKFVANTDRGPNGEPNAAGQRPFLLPQFAPEIVRFTLDQKSGKLALTQRIALKKADGSPLTGLPNTAIAGGTANTPHNDEIPVDLNGNVLPLDTLGGDFEGLVVDPKDGSFWMCDEYRPAIYHFDKTGKLIDRFVPQGTAAAAGAPAGTYGTEALPAVIAQRRQNRGFEAIALQKGKIYAFVQSPIRNPVTTSNAALNAGRNVRVVELDPATLATRQFMYIMDNPAATTADDTRADKIGDMVALPGGGFLVVERDDDSTPSDPLATITKKVYAFNLTGATDISSKTDPIDIGGGVLKTVDQMTPAELTAAGIRPVTKTLHVDLAAAGYSSTQKVEGLALIDATTIAVINDNDFRVAGITIDNATGKFTLNAGYVPEDVVLGIIKTPGLDASDRDNVANIRNWPVLGMYQPDTIASYTVGGKTYLITANEGDAREYTGFAEEARVGALALDPTAFPNGAELKLANNLGRLNVTRSLGDTDGDGDFDSLYTLGGRSFSVRTAEGELVYDSGDDFERITADALPDFFNASSTDNLFDSRSDNKGPEPEGLTLGKVDGRTYAFIGLERIGGIMVYDVTNPASPAFVEYVNPRNFAADPATQTELAGDLAPEGLLFISAHDSPTRRPLLVVSNEVSGTVSVYEIGRQAEAPDHDEDDDDRRFVCLPPFARGSRIVNELLEALEDLFD